MPTKENILISKLRAGDITVYRMLFDSYYDLLYWIARQYDLDSESARDIVQDVFAYLWEKRAHVSIQKSIKNYLVTAVHNASKNHLKHDKVKSEHRKTIILSLSSKRSGWELGYDAIFGNELEDHIEKAIDNLPPQCKEIFIMSRKQGLRNKEIAKKLSLSEKTVDTQIYRALQKIRKQLTDIYNDFFFILV